jgi:hypothetical protein
MKKGLAVFLLLLTLAPNAYAVTEGKLDQILEKQDRILKALDEIKSELQVVKVRATK